MESLPKDYKDAVRKAAEIIKKGGVILYLPTQFGA